MLLTLQRTLRGERYTMGTLAIDGEPFCDTLEPTDRHLTAESVTHILKVSGRTAVPPGTYAVEMTFSPKFCCELPLLRGVPYFEGVRIHAGNTCKDTAGCILVGRYHAKGLIIHSRDTLNELLERIARKPQGELLAITIKE